MTQRIFGRLGRGVGGARKCAEGRHIRKVPVIVPPNIQRIGNAAGHSPGRGLHRGVEVQAGGKVVGAAVGQIAQRRALLQLHQAGDGLVQRAVAAGADHQIILSAPFGGDVTGLAAGLRDEHPHQIAGAGEGRHRVEQRGAGFCLSCSWIDDKQELFHGATLTYHRFYAVKAQGVRLLCHIPGRIATGIPCAPPGGLRTARAETSCKMENGRV